MGAVIAELMAPAEPTAPSKRQQAPDVYSDELA
jgi:hypothetical protein